MDSNLVKLKTRLDFGLHYESLCALSSVYPLPCVKAFLHRNMLDINADRIRTSDWMPILNTLKINETLEYIAIRSTCNLKQDISRKVPCVNRKVPAICLKEIKYRICRSIRDCLFINRQLRHLCLDGIMIRGRDIEIISKGLFECTSLRTLSFERTSIGDELLEILCISIKNMKSLLILNLSSCHLTCKSAETLAQLIKHQYTTRHNEAWHDSLRYNKPDLDQMGGLRRLTINNNMMIGDEGSKVLADCLRDDLWIKALDMHNCGLTNQGGEYMLEMLKFNSTIVVLDIRNNNLIDTETISSIMNQLIINIRGQENDFKWLKISVVTEKTPHKRKSTKLSLGSNKRTQSHRNLLSSSIRKRSKGNESFIHSNAIGLPWRTALRAEIHKSCSPERSTPVYETLSDLPSLLTPRKTKIQKKLEIDSSKDIAIKLDDFDLNELTIKLDEEMKIRHQAEDKVNLLLAENVRLSREVAELREREEMLENEEVLENIEQSFKQFHQFLDSLKNMGLEKLVQMLGIDTLKFLNSTINSSTMSNNKYNHINSSKVKHFNNQINKTSAQIRHTNQNATKYKPMYYNACRSNIDVANNLELDMSKNVFKYSMNNELELPYNSSQSENNLNIEENKTFRIKSVDISNIYQNALAPKEVNISQKNIPNLSAHLPESNKDVDNSCTYFHEYMFMNDISNIDTYKFKNISQDSLMNYCKVNTNKINGSEMNEKNIFSRNGNEYIGLQIIENCQNKWSHRVGSVMVENFTSSEDMSMDGQDNIRQPRSKFDELYERIKNRAIINN